MSCGDTTPIDGVDRPQTSFMSRYGNLDLKIIGRNDLIHLDGLDSLDTYNSAVKCAAIFKIRVVRCSYLRFIRVKDLLFKLGMAASASSCINERFFSRGRLKNYLRVTMYRDQSNA